MNHHPFRFGVQMWGATSGAEWQEKARKAEQLGYPTATLSGSWYWEGCLRSRLDQAPHSAPMYVLAKPVIMINERPMQRRMRTARKARTDQSCEVSL